MRFADTSMRVAGGLIVLALTGCSTVQSVLPASAGGAVGTAPSTAAAGGPAVTNGAPASGIAAAGAPAGTAPVAGAAAASAARARPVELAPPLDPAAQRAFDKARQALAAGRRDEAERGFVALTKSHPDLGGPHANLGLLYLQSGKPAEAVAALELAVKASPRQAQYLDQLGIAYRHVGEFDKARAAYERAIEADPTYAPAQLNLGVLYDLYLWDAPRALEHYDRYLALTTDNDDKVKRWVAELRKRAAPKATASLASREGAPR